MKPNRLQTRMAALANSRRYAPAAATLLSLIATLPQSATAASGPEQYMGETPPGATAKLFAPGTVSSDAVELNSVLTPDGREFLFTRLVDGPGESDGYPGTLRPILYRSVYADGAWTEPQPLRLFPDAPHAWAADMSVSPDGQRLYFMGAHPVDPEGKRTDLNIWVSRRVGGGWAMAEPLSPPVNTEANEVYSSVAADGSLYFTSNRPGSSAEGRNGVYRAQKLPDGSFAEPVNIGIESTRGVGDTFVAPDESYLIFRGAAGMGGGDLYVSFRQADGGWSEPRNLGPDVNSEHLDYCPMVTPDGKYLFFSRRRSEPADGGWANVIAGDIYWVDAAVITRLRPGAPNAESRP